jgi:hypothetical protein
MKFLEEYCCPINYHPRKANVVADVLSRKVRMARLRTREIQPVQELLEQEVVVQEERIYINNLRITPDLRQEIRATQKEIMDSRNLSKKY